MVSLTHQERAGIQNDVSEYKSILESSQIPESLAYASSNESFNAAS